ncbi:MAG: threonylcarbamoyl-AMP synthase [Candidatus Pacebacteria bacterium]|nr:threonylcarbamoyl-AMP synthase [Candidatus Paceibacterota bacterium]
MKDVILYPTETIYGLGVHALDVEALKVLFAIKGRDAAQTASWLVRDIADIERYAEIGDTARRVAEHFLPGPLTLILKAKASVPNTCIAPDGTIGFRISSDSVAQKLIAEYMAAHDAPLTCTSANLHGKVPQATTEEILTQLGDRVAHITQVVDDGPRQGAASTVVRILDDTIEIIREGAITESNIKAYIL